MDINNVIKMVFAAIVISSNSMYCMDTTTPISSDALGNPIASFKHKQRERGLCGICQKPGAEVFWQDFESDGAHQQCYDLIRNCEIEIDQQIVQAFYDKRQYRAKAFMRVTNALKTALGKTSFKEFVDDNGCQALTDLYNTVGKEALKNYAYAKTAVKE
jgi:hypothetical protein